MEDTMRTSRHTQELHLAHEIVSVLPQGSIVRVCSDDRDAIRFAVRAAGMKLREVVLSRASLRKLIDDPARTVKVEYLQRDLERISARRAAYQYPRLIRKATKRPVAAMAMRTLAMASVL
jgi:hypothetical protein